MRHLGLFENFDSVPFSTIDEFVEHYVHDRKKFIIGSESASTTSSDPQTVKKFVYDTVSDMIRHYFVDNDFYLNWAGDEGRAEYDKLVDDFTKDAFENFGKFYAEWMTDGKKPYVEASEGGYSIADDKRDEAMLHLLRKASDKLKSDYIDYREEYAGETVKL